MEALASKFGRGAIVVAGIVTAAIAGSAIIMLGPEGAEPDLASPMRSAAPGLVPLEGPEGSRLLFKSDARAAFLPLISYFETQESQTHCGPASMSMVLNALGVPAPPSPAFGAYRIFTQDNVLNELTDAIITDRAVARRGMSLADVAQVLGTYGVSIDLHYAGTSSVDEFRDMAVEHLSDPGRHVIVNYSRSALGQEGSGHISPLGAYDAETDRFLILDVSRYKAPAVWVSTEQLFAAMAKPLGPDNPRTRGYLLISAPDSINSERDPAVQPPT